MKHVSFSLAFIFSTLRFNGSSLAFCLSPAMARISARNSSLLLALRFDMVGWFDVCEEKIRRSVLEKRISWGFCRPETKTGGRKSMRGKINSQGRSAENRN